MFFREKFGICLSNGVLGVGEMEKVSHRFVDSEKPTCSILKVNMIGRIVHEGVQKALFLFLMRIPSAFAA